MSEYIYLYLEWAGNSLHVEEMFKETKGRIIL